MPEPIGGICLAAAMQFGRGNGDEFSAVQITCIKDGFGTETVIRPEVIGKAGEVIAMAAIEFHHFSRAELPVGMGGMAMKIAAKETLRLVKWGRRIGNLERQA